MSLKMDANNWKYCYKLPDFTKISHYKPDNANQIYSKRSWRERDVSVYITDKNCEN